MQRDPHLRPADQAKTCSNCGAAYDYTTQKVPPDAYRSWMEVTYQEVEGSCMSVECDNDLCGECFGTSVGYCLPCFIGVILEYPNYTDYRGMLRELLKRRDGGRTGGQPHV